ncbi:MAG: hypothetical protein INQ03_12015 [Candidatus Heimdallarchaeota archaeon]|nr:hypothetical protein [Candidatus Heimdallarchaeota archaeon]
MEETSLREIIGALREVARRYSEQLPVTPGEIEKAKSIAAKCYLSHTNRKFTLTNDQFQLVINILKIQD